jgi:c-di-GMP-binding flagellar brake protein YcgR
MSPASDLADILNPRDDPRPEQRVNRRYPIALDVQYKLHNDQQEMRSGSGRTLNISTGGILFHTKDPLPASGEIDLALEWPLLLDRTCPLRLLARGQIVRSDERGTAVRLLSHDFRTSRRRSK